MRRFLCEVIPGVGETVTLGTSASHHLLRVTGIAPGESVEIFDGAGSAAEASLEGVENGCAVLRITHARQALSDGRPVWLLPALLRPAAMETVIRMATELGVVRISPLQTSRVVARGDKSDRWRRIAEAAAGQCGRSDLPQVDAPVELQAAVLMIPEGWTAQVCTPDAPASVASTGPLALFMGPEGGWTPAELEAVATAGVTPVGLGPTTLRADTAVAVALSRAASTT